MALEAPSASLPVEIARIGAVVELTRSVVQYAPRIELLSASSAGPIITCGEEANGASNETRDCPKRPWSQYGTMLSSRHEGHRTGDAESLP